jgi:hypothetical protein
MSTKNARQVGIRFDAAANARLTRFEQSTGVEAVTLARNATLACLDFFEQHGYLSFPIVVVPKNETEKEAKKPNVARNQGATLPSPEREICVLNEPPANVAGSVLPMASASYATATKRRS